MSKTKNKYYQNGYHEMALRGDKILEDLLVKWIKPIKDQLTREEAHFLYMFLKSNKLLSTFEPGFRFKRKFGDRSLPTSAGKLGDMVEARICFLWDNYGEEAVKRYYFKYLRKYYNNQKDIFILCKN